LFRKRGHSFTGSVTDAASAASAPSPCPVMLPPAASREPWVSLAFGETQGNYLGMTRHTGIHIDPKHMNSQFIAPSLPAGGEATPLRLSGVPRAIAPLIHVGGDATLRSTENWNSRAIAHRFHTVQKIHGAGFPEVSHQSFAPNKTMQPTPSRAVFCAGRRMHLALSHGGCMRTRHAFAVPACNHATFPGSCG